jgi:hypothetical protein
MVHDVWYLNYHILPNLIMASMGILGQLQLFLKDIQIYCPCICIELVASTLQFTVSWIALELTGISAWVQLAFLPLLILCPAYTDLVVYTQDRAGSFAFPSAFKSVHQRFFWVLKIFLGLNTYLLWCLLVLICILHCIIGWGPFSRDSVVFTPALKLTI